MNTIPYHIKHVLLLITTFALLATHSVLADEAPDLDDPKARAGIMKEAVLIDTLEERGPKGAELFYKAGEPIFYTGWVKQNHINGMEGLFRLKNGKKEGQWVIWATNGKKNTEFTYKNGKPVLEKKPDPTDDDTLK